MIRVQVDLDLWEEYKEHVCLWWSKSREILDKIEKEGREEEAMALIESHFREDRIGYIPGACEVNSFIWFELPGIMHLYD